MVSTTLFYIVQEKKQVGRKKKRKKSNAKLLTHESRQKAYRYSLYYYLNFSGGLNICKIKREKSLKSKYLLQKKTLTSLLY